MNPFVLLQDGDKLSPFFLQYDAAGILPERYRTITLESFDTNDRAYTEKVKYKGMTVSVYLVRSVKRDESDVKVSMTFGNGELWFYFPKNLHAAAGD